MTSVYLAVASLVMGTVAVAGATVSILLLPELRRRQVTAGVSLVLAAAGILVSVMVITRGGR
jgi:hypothetical protein